ncbi:hypothetical protein ACFOU2_09590 [Bacillus songklensis]|uniref:Uncharacterized protein n=1 Tax=Bacillus songklensis TaxID=1069116 RepID=A0ABV8B3K9_9BACI
MRDTLERVADLLMYSGPSISDVIKNAILDGHDFETLQLGKQTVVQVTSEIPYDIKVLDSYFFNNCGQLIKHIVKVNNKEKIVFDKYSEATALLTTLECPNSLVS